MKTKETTIARKQQRALKREVHTPKEENTSVIKDKQQRRNWK